MADVIHRFIYRIAEPDLVIFDAKRIIHVEAAGDDAVDIWAIICPGITKHGLRVTTVGTGMPFGVEWNYEGSTGRTPHGLVWHVFSKLERSA